MAAAVQPDRALAMRRSGVDEVMNARVRVCHRPCRAAFFLRSQAENRLL